MCFPLCRDKHFREEFHRLGRSLIPLSTKVMATATASITTRQEAVAYPGFQREGCLSQAPYKKWGGGGRFRSDIRKVRGGGGGGGGENIYMYLPTCYLGILHTRARMNVKYMPAKVNLFFLSSIC